MVHIGTFMELLLHCLSGEFDRKTHTHIGKHLIISKLISSHLISSQFETIKKSTTIIKHFHKIDMVHIGT